MNSEQRKIKKAYLKGYLQGTIDEALWNDGKEELIGQIELIEIDTLTARTAIKHAQKYIYNK